MSVDLLTEHHLWFLSLKGGCTGSSESALVEMPHCWESHVAAQMSMLMYPLTFGLSLHLHPYQVYSSIEGSGDTVHGCLDLPEPWLLAISISVKILCAGPYKYVAYQYRTG